MSLLGERSQRTLLRVSGRVRHEDLYVKISAELALQSRQQVGEGCAVGVLRMRLLRLVLSKLMVKLRYGITLRAERFTEQVQMATTPRTQAPCLQWGPCPP